MFEDPLKLLPMHKWDKLKEAYKCDLPQSVSGIVTLQTQQKLIESGLDYGLKVFCPFGDVSNGMVALNKKGTRSEILILFFNNDTTILEEALRKTKLIDWKQPLEIPFAPLCVANCVKKIIYDNKLKIDYAIINDTFVLDTSKPLFQDIRLPSTFTFDLLSLKHVELINEKWPHRYPNSSRYFDMLIRAKQGYGLFKQEELYAWVFIKEIGVLGHLYTLEQHRRKGYGEAVLKLISNVLLKDKKYVIAFCIQQNFKAHNLYKKLGFEIINEVEFLQTTGI